MHDDVARFCTTADVSEAFFKAYVDGASGAISLPMQGQLFEAVRVAQQLKQTGAGKVVAILDSGFDMSIRALREAACEASVTCVDTVTRVGHHGTVVALLVRQLAPQARLLLLEVGPTRTPQKRDIGSALQVAFAHNADVVNMSFEFLSVQPEVAAVPVPESTADDRPLVERLVSQTRMLLASSSHHLGAACRPPCEICEALADKPPATVAIAAAGNRDDIGVTCPSCHPSVVGTGFEYESHDAADGGDVLRRSLPVGYRQNLFAELTVTQPDGYEGTSFAAPLVSGMMASLHGESSLFDTMWWLPTALTPTAFAQLELRDGGEIGAERQAELADAALAGYAVVAESCPDEHRHWLPGRARPCAVCSWFMSDWYADQSALLIWLGRADSALPIAQAGATVNPCSAGLVGNVAEASRRMALGRGVSPAERARLLEDAVTHYHRAIELGGSRDDLEARLAAMPTSR